MTGRRNNTFNTRQTIQWATKEGQITCYKRSQNKSHYYYGNEKGCLQEVVLGLGLERQEGPSQVEGGEKAQAKTQR